MVATSEAFSCTTHAPLPVRDLIRFQGVSFPIEDTEALQDEARAAAAEDLLAKAAHIAAPAGVELGRLVYITESGGTARPAMVVAEQVSFASAVPTPIQAGQLEIVVSLQGAFEIQDAGG